MHSELGHERPERMPLSNSPFGRMVQPPEEMQMARHAIARLHISP